MSHLPDGELAHDAALLRLAVTCPGCTTAPAIRITSDAALAIAHVAPATRISTYRCHRRRCGRIFELTAAHYHAAF